MADKSASPRLYLQRCDEDIDLLSEVLGKNTDASSEEGIDVSDSLLEDDMDELTSYLCGNSSHLKAELSQCPAQLDPFMSPSVSGSSGPPFMKQSGPCSRSTSPTPSVRLSPVHKLTSDVGSSSERPGPKSILLYLPKSQPCTNKNALAARENRKKKKEYVKQLETDVGTLKTENTELKEKLSGHDETIKCLEEQVKYLQNVIANQSTLSALLSNIQNTSGIQLKSSLATRKQLLEVGPRRQSEVGSTRKSAGRPASEVENRENDKSSIRRVKRKCEFQSENIVHSKRFNVEKSVASRADECCEKERTLRTPGGVCLHVSGSEVSLEFCSSCSKMAASSRVMDDHSYVRSIVN